MVEKGRKTGSGGKGGGECSGGSDGNVANLPSGVISKDCGSGGNCGPLSISYYMPAGTDIRSIVCDELVLHKDLLNSAIFEKDSMKLRSHPQVAFDIDRYIARLRVHTDVGAVWFTQVELGAVASALKRPLYCAAYIDGRWTWQVYHGFRINEQFRFNHDDDVPEDCSSYGLNCAQLDPDFNISPGDIAIINHGNYHYTAALVDVGATVKCPLCSLEIRTDAINQHFVDVHDSHEAHAGSDPQSMGTVPCEVCRMLIHPETMSHHFDVVHPVSDDPHSVVKKQQRGADASGVSGAWQPDSFATALVELEKYGEFVGDEDRDAYIALIRTTSEDQMYYALTSLTRVVEKSLYLHEFLLGQLWDWFVTVTIRMCRITDTSSEEPSVTVLNQPQMHAVGALIHLVSG